ncbi:MULTISPECIES: hypothetical protein [unclassified Streptomyces]|uniref:hypothetical protein n=1 Tax=unclassified Streptomyces TaxID=2593676 RepID=UPI001BE87F08|nr:MULTISPECIES: hypothetical protein [unclassified Streptomyces]MBT2403895.1 hypothetical protein [Streptomyces sp. ISL-21]MBT2613148.1 hypothetical protein [Streptomyces sp. ISL-87]
MTDMFEIWQRAELAKRVDVLESFLGSRYAGDPALSREVASDAAAARTALAAADPWRAQDCLDALERRAADWRGHPHFPAVPRPADADGQVRDYVKDRLRGVLSPVELDRLDFPHVSLSVLHRRLCGHPELDPQTREDIHYVHARGRMALDLGHADAAAREVERLRAIEARLTDGDG